MSKGAGRIERRIGELFVATKDRALSTTEIAAYAFMLAEGIAPNRKQRLSATRAAHRLLYRAAAAIDAVETAFNAVVAEATAKLGRPPGGRGREQLFFSVGRRFVAVDAKFGETMETCPSWGTWQQAWRALKRERERFGGVLVDRERSGWRSTETKDRRLWFHPADYPVRIWAVSIEREGVSWAEAEITRIDNTYVHARYGGAYVRLDREMLARSWTIYRNVFFTSVRSGHAARSFDQMWWERYWRPGSVPPPAMQMALADAIKLLGVPADFTCEDIIKAFRRASFRCHPDYGGTEEEFIKLVEARDRLLAALGTKEKPPKAPTFAPKGARLRYGAWRPRSSSCQLGGHTRPLIG